MKTISLSIILFFLVTGIISQTPDKKAIEQEYLTKARQNIEKYRKGDASIQFLDTKGKPLTNLKVEINQQTQDFLFGNLSEEILSPELTPAEAAKFGKMFTDLYNFTELTVKWEPYEPLQGKPEWQLLQQKLNWCAKNGVTPKGHNLGWTHSAGTPRWLLALPDAMAFDLYKARIYDLVGGFKNQVSMWDVVNEPINTVPMDVALKDSIYESSVIDDGSNRYNVSNITMEQTIPWVEKSYKWAYEANSKGDFVINEYNIVSTPAIREKYYQFVKELKKRNVPVTGIGIQAHEPREMWFSPVEVMASFDKFNDLGLPLHITELTPQSSGKPITGGWREGTWTEDAQAEFAEQFMTLAFSHPLMVSINWWGLSDRFIWLEGGGLIDKNFNPKPVYTRLKKLIKNDWMTLNVNLISDKNGKAAFRGFYGKYKITVTKPDGSKAEFDLHLKNGSQSSWTYNL